MSASASTPASGWAVLPMSTVANLSKNPIRRFIDTMPIDAKHPKQPHIPLSLGDPTVFGNFALPPSLIAMMQASLACVLAAAPGTNAPLCNSHWDAL